MNSYIEIDIEELDKKYKDHLTKEFETPTEDDVQKYKDLIFELLTTNESLDKLKKKYVFYHKNSFLIRIFQILKDEYKFTDVQEESVREKLRIKRVKSHSGIISITIFTSNRPSYIDKETGNLIEQDFSCAFNCSFCPKEPGQPRSYLMGEPGVLRANRYKFDCVDQMHARMNGLYIIGHPIDKLEILVLGGTWCSYPVQYRYEFVRDMYYAANIFYDKSRRQRCSLEEEIRINQTARCRVIGLTLETRPDTITPEEIIRFRSYGCTRIQLGIQHTDPHILHKIQRKCPNYKTIVGIELLKNCGFKVDSHWMPNLPGSTPEKDEKLLCDELLGIVKKTYKYNWFKKEQWIYHELKAPDYQTDQWKIYPCTIVPWTEIEEWFKEGSYIPYSQDELIDVIVKTKKLMFPWIRLNRIIRDIPKDYVMTKEYSSSLRTDMRKIVDEDGFRCCCIRCREVKSQKFDIQNAQLVIRVYNASKGTEYFISYETKDEKTLYGFLRLRLPPIMIKHPVFEELTNTGLIRELHVYGQLQEVGKKSNTAVQHKGIGKMLIKKAEEITKDNKYRKIAVIAGEGVREYYKKHGYFDDNGEGRYMIKYLY